MGPEDFHRERKAIQAEYNDASLRGLYQTTSRYRNGLAEPERRAFDAEVTGLSAPIIRNCALVGFVGGGALGGAVGYLIHVPLVLAIGGGAALGGAVGATVGTTIAAKRVIVHIRGSQEYERWKADSIRNKTFALFKEFIETHEAFQEFLCPITNDFPTVAVRSPNGHIYDRDAIVLHLAVHEETMKRAYHHPAASPEDQNRTNCPMRGRPFTVDQLVYVEDFSYQLLATIRRELNLHMQALNAYDLTEALEHQSRMLDKSINEGLRALATSSRENAREVLVASVGNYVGQADEIGSSPEQVAAGVLALTERHQQLLRGEGLTRPSYPQGSKREEKGAGSSMPIHSQRSGSEENDAGLAMNASPPEV